MAYLEENGDEQSRNPDLDKADLKTRRQHEEHCETIEEYQGASDITAEVHDGQRTGNVEHGEVFGDHSLQGVQ